MEVKRNKSVSKGKYFRLRYFIPWDTSREHSRQTNWPPFPLSCSGGPGGGGAGSCSSGVIQRRPPNVLKHIHLPDFPGIWVWSRGCCAILPYKTHGALLDLFLGRAGDWLGNWFAEPTHTASPSEGLLGWDTLLMEGLPASGGIVLGTLRRGVTAPV